jgi:hypothetical protein
MAISFFSVCYAEEGFHSKSLPFSSEATIGAYNIKFHSKKLIDINKLLENINGNDTSLNIQLKIDAKRLSLYPKEEMAIEISDNQVSPKKIGPMEPAATTMGLKNQIYWWNHSNIKGEKWSALYGSNVATLFFNVSAGTYKIDDYNNNLWSTINTIGIGKTYVKWAHWLAGDYSLKGFRGQALSTTNKADIIMLFFQ